MATPRSTRARQAEAVYRDQLHARATLDYDGRMRLPPPRQQEAKRFGGGYHARGTSGLYDWFYELAPEEQQRIRSNWMSPQGFKVDELEDKMPIGEWLSLTRRIDMSRAAARGRRIETKRYGGLNPDRVLEAAEGLERARKTTRAGRRPRGRPGRGEEHAGSRCHFFTDDDGVVHPIAATCGHVRAMSARERQETYGDDEEF
jgi:hypothetical protein